MNKFCNFIIIKFLIKIQIIKWLTGNSKKRQEEEYIKREEKSLRLIEELKKKEN